MVLGEIPGNGTDKPLISGGDQEVNQSPPFVADDGRTPITGPEVPGKPLLPVLEPFNGGNS